MPIRLPSRICNYLARYTDKQTYSRSTFQNLFAIADCFINRDVDLGFLLVSQFVPCIRIVFVMQLAFKKTDGLPDFSPIFASVIGSVFDDLIPDSPTKQISVVTIDDVPGDVFDSLRVLEQVDEILSSLFSFGTCNLLPESQE